MYVPLRYPFTPELRTNAARLAQVRPLRSRGAVRQRIAPSRGSVRFLSAHLVLQSGVRIGTPTDGWAETDNAYASLKQRLGKLLSIRTPHPTTFSFFRRYGSNFSTHKHSRSQLRPTRCALPLYVQSWNLSCESQNVGSFLELFSSRAWLIAPIRSQ